MLVGTNLSSAQGSFSFPGEKDNADEGNKGNIGQKIMDKVNMSFYSIY